MEMLLLKLGNVKEASAATTRIDTHTHTRTHTHAHTQQLLPYRLVKGGNINAAQAAFDSNCRYVIPRNVLTFFEKKIHFIKKKTSHPLYKQEQGDKEVNSIKS